MSHIMKIYKQVCVDIHRCLRLFDRGPNHADIRRTSKKHSDTGEASTHSNGFKLMYDRLAFAVRIAVAVAVKRFCDHLNNWQNVAQLINTYMNTIYTV